MISSGRTRSRGRLSSIRHALKRNGWQLAGPYRHHPLSARVIGLCGKHYTGVYVKAENRRTYRCSGVKCNDSVIDAEALEAVVWASLVNFMSDKDKLLELAQEWSGDAPDYRHVYEARIEELDTEIAGIRQITSTQLVEFARQGVDPQAVATATATLTREVQEKEKLRAEAQEMLDDAEACLGRTGDLKRLVEQASCNLNGLAPHRKSEVLDLLEIRVTIKGEVPPPRRLECTTTAWFNQRQSVPRELTDDLWAQVSELMPAVRPQRNSVDPRTVINAIIYKVRNRCGWESLPSSLPGKEIVRNRVRKWTQAGVLDQMLELLAEPWEKPPTAPLPPLEVGSRLRGITEKDAGSHGVPDWSTPASTSGWTPTSSPGRPTGAM